MPDTNRDLIAALKQTGVLRTSRIEQAFHDVDRVDFVSADLRPHAYEDVPLPIGFSQTISQPTTVAIMLEALQPQPNERCLDIGAGSGWVTALLAVLVTPTGQVTGVERLPDLARQLSERIAGRKRPNILITTGDASRGWPPGAPYDIIHVAAAAAAIPPELIQELRFGGRLIMPVGDDTQDLALITKTGDNTYSERRYSGFQFVPLITDTTIL